MNKKSFVIVFMTVFIDLLGFGLVVPTLPNYTKELGASNIQVGFIAAVFSLMNFLCTPFLGSWSDRVGRRPIILFGIAANFIGYLLFSRANTIPLLIISRFISGIGSSNISAAQAYIADISTPENRTKSLGMIGAAFGLGFVFGPALGGLIKAHFGMEYVGYTAAVLCFVNLITAYFMLPESLKEMNLTAPISFIPINDYIKAFNMPIIKQLFSMWFLYVMAFSMMQTIVALLWKEHYHQDDRHIGYLFTIIGVSSALVQGGLVGVLVKKLGENKMLIYGTFLMIAGFALLPLVPVKGFWLGSCLAIVLLSLGSGCLTPSTTALISKAADAHEQGRMLGLSQSVGSMSRVVGPMMSGFVYSIHFAAPFLNSSLLMVACLFLAQVIIGLLSKKEKTQGV